MCKYVAMNFDYTMCVVASLIFMQFCFALCKLLLITEWAFFKSRMYFIFCMNDCSSFLCIYFSYNKKEAANYFWYLI